MELRAWSWDWSPRHGAGAVELGAWSWELEQRVEETRPEQTTGVSAGPEGPYLTDPLLSLPSEAPGNRV